MNASSYGNAITAYFHNQSDAEDAVRDLQSAGFRADQIGSSYEDIDSDSSDSGSEYHGQAAATADSGKYTGETGDHRSFWDRVKEFFSGDIDSATDDVRDRGLTASGDRTATGDWNQHAGIPDHYRERLSGGGGLVTVVASGRAEEAEQILTRNRGEIDRQFAGSFSGTGEAGQQFSNSTDTSFAGSSRNSMGDTADAARNQDVAGERRIQLISEVLRVRKERVSRGEVRLRKEVKTETQNIAVPVTREEIVIERNQVGGEQPASGQIGNNDEIRVPLSEERVQVDKVPVVREEVRVGKRPVSETRNVSDQVRHEELDVEGAGSDRSSPNRKTA